MYSKQATKSYQKGTKPKSRYKKNILPLGATELASAIVSGEVADRFGKWAKGKKSKFAKGINPATKQRVRIRAENDLRDAISVRDSDTVTPRMKKYAEKEISKLEIKLAKLSRSGNPGKLDNISPEVEDMSKEWHGRGNKDLTEIEEIESYEEDVVELADLEELGIIQGNCKYRFNISFKKDRPKLCCDGEGHNLELIGGDQELDLDKANISYNDKLLTPIGYVYSIVYETDKHHLEGSNGYPESYQHFFGEEYYKSKILPEGYEDGGMDEWFEDLLLEGWVAKAISKGLLPIAVYNQTDKKILLTGGEYEVKDVGIVN